jgi:hypothetical protein
MIANSPAVDCFNHLADWSLRSESYRLLHYEETVLQDG